MADPINPMNKYVVASNPYDDKIAIMALNVELTSADALLLAAWIVTLADPLGEKFGDYLEAVQNT